MAKHGSKQHQEKLQEFKAELEKEGWRVILLEAKSPDGIAVKDGEICAVEVIGKELRRAGEYKGKYKTGEPRYQWTRPSGFTFAGKRRIYHMFDDVIFGVYYKEDKDKRTFTPLQYKDDDKVNSPFYRP